MLQWGYSERTAPPGAQFWVWFKKGGGDVDVLWENLRNSVSGDLFSILTNSLNLLNILLLIWNDYSCLTIRM